MSNVVRLPYSVTRRAHARKPRRSKRGTPEQRAVKALAQGLAELRQPPVPCGDPVFVLIDLHRKASALHSAAIDEQDRLERAGHASRGISEQPCQAEIDAWHALLSAPPQTLAGLRAWASYLKGVEPWMLEDQAGLIVGTLDLALAKPGTIY